VLQENLSIDAERRQETGKNAANRLRARDMIPAVLYGGGRGTETVPLSIPRKSLLNLLRKGIHENAIFQLKMKGADAAGHVMIRDLSVDPVTRAMLHVDFVRILMDKKLKVKTAIEIVGIPFGVKNEGGLLNVVTHELSIECLPADIPHSIPVDVTELHLHGSIRVSDLKVDEKVRVLDASDRVIAHVAVPKAEEVVAAVATAEAAPTAAEPEVIKKGKKEEEGAEEKGAEKAAKPGEKAAKPGEKAEKKEKK
jgi:large subunit ribosomal protein L25